MFYFIKFVDNNVLQIILLVSLATLLFYTLGSIAQKFYHFKTNNNNFTIPFGIIIYFLITFILYTPFLYFHFNSWENLLLYLYLIKQFIYTFVVLLFLNSLLTKWKIPNWRQLSNLFVSVIIIGFLLWLFHYLLITIGISPTIDSSNFFFDQKEIRYQSIITELNIIKNMNNNIDLTIILKWIIPFIIINLLYWSSKLLFINITNLISIICSTIFTFIIIIIFSFLIVESLIYIIFPFIYLYFVLIFLYTKETFGNNLIIFFAFFVLASLFTISSTGIVFLLLLGIPTICYLFIRAKSTVGLFLLFVSLFAIQLFFVLNTLENGVIYGLIALVIGIIILIPMFAVLNPGKVKDLIQVEKTIKKNAILILYFSLGITILFSLLLGLKSENNVFVIIKDGFTQMAYPTLTISLMTLFSLYFIFSLYICFFKKEKATNFLLITSLIIVIGFNPLTLSLFQYINLMNVNIFQTYYSIFGICIFLNLFKYVQNKLNFYSFFSFINCSISNKIIYKSKK